MKNYLVIFSLTQTGNVYTNLYAYLKSSGNWATPFQGVWFVSSTLNAAQIRDGVRQRIYQGDRVLVVPVDSNNWGTFGMTKEINDWMRSKFG